MDISYHFVRELVESGQITLEYVPSEDNAADIMTKGLARDAHVKLSKILGVVKCFTK